MKVKHQNFAGILSFSFVCSVLLTFACTQGSGNAQLENLILATFGNLFFMIPAVFFGDYWFQKRKSLAPILVFSAIVCFGLVFLTNNLLSFF